MRPAQLTPEIIEKFNNDHIDKLVDSFADSVEYQNKSDREAMIKHYSYLSGKDNKTTIAGTIMFLATLSAYTFVDKIPETIALPLLIAEVALILAPQVFSKILSLFTFFNAKKKLPKD